MELFLNYLEKNCGFGPFILHEPDKMLNYIIVIPSIAEPDILDTIKSLWDCVKPEKSVEIIVVINSSDNADNETIRQNLFTEQEIYFWGRKNNSKKLAVIPIVLSNIPKKLAGAGFARKVGMDEAIRRFIAIDNPKGIICSLDADSLVSNNYLIEIEKLYNYNQNCNGCAIYFEHPVEGDVFDDQIYKTIIEYELHLRYYKQTLKYIGFPYYHHTVGSSFTVKAKSYCKQGGMSKKQAGEDFYFLHKIMPLGHFQELNSCCVMPSSRPSNRVIFGTGATIKEYAVDSRKEFLTFHFDSFLPLKDLFTKKHLFFKSNPKVVGELILSFEEVLKDFLIKNRFDMAIHEMNANTSQLYSFYKRFFNWFDAFRLVQYLNYAHSQHFTKQPVAFAVIDYLNAIGRKEYNCFDAKSLLIEFREIEKSDQI